MSSNVCLLFFLLVHTTSTAILSVESFSTTASSSLLLSPRGGDQLPSSSRTSTASLSFSNKKMRLFSTKQESKADVDTTASTTETTSSSVNDEDAAKKASNVVNRGDNDGYVRQTWNPLRLLVLRLGLTEPMGTSPFNYGKYDGTFVCAYCGHPLFDSDAKYDSRSGWPSFWSSLKEDSISYKMELDGRLECRCKQCSSHLGHVFLDGPRPSEVASDVFESSPSSDPRGKSNTYLPRFCINGAAMMFNTREKSNQQET